MKKFSRFVMVWSGIVGVTVLVWMGAGGTPEKAANAAGDTYIPATIVAPEGGKTEKQKAKMADEGGCHGGCSLAKHDVPELSAKELSAAIESYGAQAPNAASDALDTLLFHNTVVSKYLDETGGNALSEAHLAFLRTELKRTTAEVELRLVREDGTVMVATGPMRVPLGKKQHLQPTTNAVQPLEFNGTVVRTGLYHLWSRY